MLIHLLCFQFMPLELHLSLHFLSPLLQLFLLVPLLDGIAQHHLRLEGLHLILRVVHVLIGFVDGLHASLHLQLVLDCVHLPSLDFLLFQSLNPVIILLLSQGIDSIRPVLDSCIGFFLQFQSILVPLLVLVLLAANRTLLLDPLQLVNTYHSSVPVELLLGTSALFADYVLLGSCS
jgi:hypothetical protein